MRKLGFTLVEVMVVIAIILLLAAIVTPIYLRSKRSAKETVSVENLRQLHLAMTLYRADYGGDGIYGDVDAMGLPTSLQLYGGLAGEPYGITEEMLASPCGVHPSLDARLNVMYWMASGGPRVEVASLEFQEDLILWYDPSCNDSGVQLENPYRSKLILGVLLGGELVRRRAKGNFEDPAWWVE